MNRKWKVRHMGRQRGIHDVIAGWRTVEKNAAAPARCCNLVPPTRISVFILLHLLEWEARAVQRSNLEDE
jgi:hypothetical protein